ncbi:MAG: 4Fe-4S binding protein [Candidatus Methanomethylophilaceae archaeon]|nr:4Fe-4S binding protein [Candidatus Methanomethylophilaceae archaeon]MBR1452764.1 4Fe-4S binding protein [Candidatus Methanomethylophilaceae archaeon]MBR4202955.1 4Fe-4S binding protein [Candidatus Methanomethylophilaceae archaeon]
MVMASISDLVVGGRIIKPGNSEQFNTGDWRTYVPVVDQDKCIDCGQCWIYCPDNSVVFREGHMSGFKLTHCKGCGICSKVCPRDAIVMKEE